MSSLPPVPDAGASTGARALVIGWDGAVEGLFWVAAQGGYGIQSAAGASLLAAGLIQRQPLPQELLAQGIDPVAVSPSRLR